MGVPELWRHTPKGFVAGNLVLLPKEVAAALAQASVAEAEAAAAQVARLAARLRELGG